jgi:hypothetical protein
MSDQIEVKRYFCKVLVYCREKQKAECYIQLGVNTCKILFPLSVLEQLQLYPSDTFYWTPNEQGPVKAEDIEVCQRIADIIAKGPHLWDEEEISKCFSG